MNLGMTQTDNRILINSLFPPLHNQKLPENKEALRKSNFALGRRAADLKRCI